MAASDAQKRAVARYDLENTVRIGLKLNFRTDRDILDWLKSQQNKQGYIKQLIRDDIERRGVGESKA